MAVLSQKTPATSVIIIVQYPEVVFLGIRAYELVLKLGFCLVSYSCTCIKQKQALSLRALCSHSLPLHAPLLDGGSEWKGLGHNEAGLDAYPHSLTQARDDSAKRRSVVINQIARKHIGARRKGPFFVIILCCCENWLPTLDGPRSVFLSLSLCLSLGFVRKFPASISHLREREWTREDMRPANINYILHPGKWVSL